MTRYLHMWRAHLPAPGASVNTPESRSQATIAAVLLCSFVPPSLYTYIILTSTHSPLSSSHHISRVLPACLKHRRTLSYRPLRCQQSSHTCSPRSHCYLVETPHLPSHGWPPAHFSSLFLKPPSHIQTTLLLPKNPIHIHTQQQSSTHIQSSALSAQIPQL